jgi:hypothetical protein
MSTTIFTITAEYAGHIIATTVTARRLVYEQVQFRLLGFGIRSPWQKHAQRAALQSLAVLQIIFGGIECHFETMYQYCCLNAIFFTIIMWEPEANGDVVSLCMC